MKTKFKKSSISLTLGIVSVSIIALVYLSLIFSGWNLSPQAAHLLGIGIVVALTSSIVGFILGIFFIKTLKGTRLYLALILNLFVVLFVLLNFF